MHSFHRNFDWQWQCVCVVFFNQDLTIELWPVVHLKLSYLWTRANKILSWIPVKRAATTLGKKKEIVGPITEEKMKRSDILMPTSCYGFITSWTVGTASSIAGRKFPGPAHELVQGFKVKWNDEEWHKLLAASVHTANSSHHMMI